ncbi:ImmA/IrrE family metallo-endopeptidase [Enterococcus sp. AD013-P3]|uniref:ImmA/IrrE family metallo-endopeptidase n=1 Tax=Enterococcus sp. AD013-P3 TaxID=3411036 RepID=UPI003B9557D1
MNDFETLLDMVSNEVPVIEGPLLEKGYEGLYRQGRIYIEKSLSTNRKKERLMEEYSHHKTSVGNIINYDSPENRKQELRARRLALEALVPLDKLIECSFAGCIGNYECAEYLEVEIDILADALRHYANKLGQVSLHDGYILHFTGDSVIVLNPRK